MFIGKRKNEKEKNDLFRIGKVNYRHFSTIFKMHVCDKTFWLKVNTKCKIMLTYMTWLA